MIPHGRRPNEPRTRFHWMRGATIVIVGLAIESGAALASPGRPATLQATAGARFFNDQLDLNEDISLGLRLGIGLTPTVGLAIDYVSSNPTRDVTGAPAATSALRALARADVLSGDTRPYVVLGVGGLLVNFDDSPDFATGTLTLGAGVARRLRGNFFLTAEASGDLYRNRVTTYGPTGAVLTSSARTTQGLVSLAAGVGIEF